jgi:hypothetical protein
VEGITVTLIPGQERRIKLALAHLLSLCVTASLVAACIPIPYKPSATVAPETGIDVSPTLTVSNRRDDAVKKIAGYLQAEAHEITVISNRDLAPVAFPDGDVALEKLLEPDSRARLRTELGLSYLILVGDLAQKELTHHGGFIPLLGLGTSTDLANLVATVIDLADGKAVTGLSSTAQGRMSGVIYGFYGLFVVPMTDKGAYDGLAKGIADAIRGRSDIQGLRVAIVHVGGLEANKASQSNESGSGCPEGVECQHVTTMPAPLPAEEVATPAQPPEET